jgi:hypothetical protein
MPLAVFDLSGNPLPLGEDCTLLSLHDNLYQYHLGQLARPSFPFLEEQVACGSGIHFFLTQKQAEDFEY